MRIIKKKCERVNENFCSASCLRVLVVNDSCREEDLSQRHKGSKTRESEYLVATERQFTCRINPPRLFNAEPVRQFAIIRYVVNHEVRALALLKAAYFITASE